MLIIKKFVAGCAVTLGVVVAGNVLAANVDLNINTWDGYIPDDLKSKYVSLMKSKHDLDVTMNIHYVASQDEAGPALRSGKADIVTSPQNIPKDGRHRMIKDRLALALDVSRIPNHKNILPALQTPDYMTKKGKLYGVPLIRGPFAMIYNTAIVKEEPRSWNILWDPKYKGQISIPGDVYDALIYSVALSEGVSREDIFAIENIDTPAIQGKLETLVGSADNFWTGVATAGDAKGLALVPSWGFAIPGLRELGEEWKVAYVDEGVTGFVDNQIVAAHVAENPHKLTAVYEWLDFTLSDEYQAYIVRGLSSTPVTTTVEKVLTPEEITEFHLDDPSHFKNNIVLWQPVSKQVSNGMKAMWRAASNEVMDEKLAAAQVRRDAVN